MGSTCPEEESTVEVQRFSGFSADAPEQPKTDSLEELCSYTTDEIEKSEMNESSERSANSTQTNKCVESAGQKSQKSNGKYVLYAARWLILAVCCLLALTNAIQWISYITLTIETNVFYCENGSSCSPALITNQIFQCVAVITGIGGMYITDNYGIRLSIMSGVTLNFIGSIVRLVSSSPHIDSAELRQTLLHSGSAIVAAAQAFFLILPSKIAECWFPEDQRAISNVFTFIANPAGVALGTLSPQLMFQSEFYKNSWNLFNFNAFMAVFTTITFVLSFFIRRSLPPTPPSSSSASHTGSAPPFWNAILLCLKNPQFLIQMLTFAMEFAQLWGVMVILPDILTANGYSKLQGWPTAACATFGVLASLLAGSIADKTKKFKEIIQFCSIGFFFSAVFLRLYLIRPRGSFWDDIAIMVGSSLLGAFATPPFPIGVEMGVETTFPVYEATSSGLLVLTGQLAMFIFYGIFEYAKTVHLFYPVTPAARKLNVGNWKFVLDVWCVIALTTAVLTLCCLKPIYKRIAYEQSVLQKQREKSSKKSKETTTTDTTDDVPT